MTAKPDFMTALLDEFVNLHATLKEIHKIAHQSGDPLENILEIRLTVNDALTYGSTVEELLAKTVR